MLFSFQLPLCIALVVKCEILGAALVQNGLPVRSLPGAGTVPGSGSRAPGAAMRPSGGYGIRADGATKTPLLNTYF